MLTYQIFELMINKLLSRQFTHQEVLYSPEKWKRQQMIKNTQLDFYHYCDVCRATS